MLGARTILVVLRSRLRKKKELLWKASVASTKGVSHEEVLHLRCELNVLLDKENHMWAQRSHIQWLTNGDRNIGYFHGDATQRKQKNFIKGIRNSSSEWITDKNVVSDIFVDFYSRLFISSRLMTLLEFWKGIGGELLHKCQAD